MELNLQRLCIRIGYEFKQIGVLKQALTHCSAGAENNERLEFLGDSILSFVIANSLYAQFPQHSEGQLSRLRAFLVKGEMLAQIALEISLGDCLYLGVGELKSGGFRRESILADTLEAIFAAIFLDGGIHAAQNTILNLYKSRLEDDVLNNNLKDPKTQLQELLQAQKKPLPQYRLDKIDGEEHDQRFYVTCRVKDLNLSSQGEGPNRRKAEQEAALELLRVLQ